jgi:choline dehydrogenase-like flavoprotein
MDWLNDCVRRRRHEVVDQVRTGDGAPGAAVAWSLAETKMRILCLDQGDWVKPTDYPGNGRDWEARLRLTRDIRPQI